MYDMWDLLFGSDQLSIENNIQFLVHIKYTGITARFSLHWQTACFHFIPYTMSNNSMCINNLSLVTLDVFIDWRVTSQWNIQTLYVKNKLVVLTIIA
jgi:hypothetical protein